MTKPKQVLDTYNEFLGKDLGEEEAISATAKKLKVKYLDVEGVIIIDKELRQPEEETTYGQII